MAGWVAGCGVDAPPVGVVGHVAAYFGGVAADEPQAALVGRDALSAGGTAADAVVAMAFTMMVTRPDAAGLGGGGVCVYYDRVSNKAEAIDFLPRVTRIQPPPGRWAASTPGSPRGLFALQARYGLLRWEQAVLPAERLARFGMSMPRGLVHAVAAARPRVDGSPDLRALLTGPDGKIVAEGGMLRQLALSATLSNIRAVGPGPFYSAAEGRRFVDGVRAAGGWLSMEDMRAYRPHWLKTVDVPFGSHKIHFAPSPAVGGRVAAAIWTALGENRRFARAAPGDRRGLVAAAAESAIRATLSRPSTERASAGLLAVDRMGNAASCVLTMNRAFGSGLVATGTGIVVAAPAESGSTLGLAPAVVANHNVPQAFMAATGAGNSYAPVALATVLLGALSAEQPLDRALAANERPAGADAGARVNIMYCPEGIVLGPAQCVVKSDPRGFGYAINAAAQ